MLSVAMIVKNEAPSMHMTLQPLLEGGIKHFLILDTGSTDETIKVSRQLFQAFPDVAYHIHEEPFVDFSTSRNRALELAEQHFAAVPFILMPDAEWQLQNVPQLLQFCEQQQTVTPPLLFLVRILTNTLDFYVPRLFSTRAGIRFVGSVHEVPPVSSQQKAPAEIHFIFNGSSYGAEKTRKRWQRDLILLQKEYQANSKAPRTVFYLAQTYECLGKLTAAYRFYQYRAALTGWVEEDFITQFRLGCLAEKLSKTDEAYSWEQALNHYHRAYDIRCQRIEPLVKIADHYWPENKPLCYLYARSACEAPFPEDDRLFIEKIFYDYTRFEILSRCAWYVGQYQQGYEATQRALSVRPNTPHLKNNLLLYREKLAQLNPLGANTVSVCD